GSGTDRFQSRSTKEEEPGRRGTSRWSVCWFCRSLKTGV
ncbi:MAG: hypothetical protein AVDCRST_MAG43-1660, partial [uncultured Thermomicrobiales bacterium]